ncbi:serine/threonine-protein kinase [Streptomyces sp. B6B3]|uniref:serine/threonine-protein kinase n=1 Tax=Streptomyces sp. B6B3 TaxID=3153570 RepID=UPI00325D4855
MEPLADEDPREVGRYRLLYRLGAGGMGRVYLGRSSGGRYVALKLVHPGLTAAPGFRERFAREVRASRAVDGPGTVAVVAADADAATPWLASAYVPGPSLAEVVHEHGPLPEAAVWRLLSGLAEALGSVHACRLVHRDLKPSNVLVSQDGPRLIDFGIARAADETGLTATGMAVGSAGYMSPEQAEGRDVTQAADVFALGAVLVYAATGRGPFGTGSGPDVMYRVVHHEPDLGAVPTSLAAVMRRCLAKRAADRPSLAELRAVAAEHDRGERDWLPGSVTARIARRAEHLLNLETEIEAGHRDPATAPTQVVGRAAAPTRPLTTTRGSDGAPEPGWIRGPSLGRPTLSLWGVVPMLALAAIVPQKHELVDDYPETADGIDFASLTAWAEHTHWFMAVTGLLVFSLPLLQYLRARLHLYGEGGVRAWVAASACYWLLWAVLVGLHTVWYLGMDDGFNGDDAMEHVSPAYIVLDMSVGLGLFVNAAVAPFAAAAALVRLNRALTADLSVRSGA